MANPLVAPTVVAIGLVTYRGIKSGSATYNPVPHFPLPSQYVSIAVIFGLLGVLPDRASRLAAMTGWGLDVAVLLRLWNPGGQVTQVNAIAAASENGGSAANTVNTTPGSATNTGNPIINFVTKLASGQWLNP